MRTCRSCEAQCGWILPRSRHCCCGGCGRGTDQSGWSCHSRATSSNAGSSSRSASAAIAGDADAAKQAACSAEDSPSASSRKKHTAEPASPPPAQPFISTAGCFRAAASKRAAATSMRIAAAAPMQHAPSLYASPPPQPPPFPSPSCVRRCAGTAACAPASADVHSALSAATLCLPESAASAAAAQTAESQSSACHVPSSGSRDAGGAHRTSCGARLQSTCVHAACASASLPPPPWAPTPAGAGAPPNKPPEAAVAVLNAALSAACWRGLSGAAPSPRFRRPEAGSRLMEGITARNSSCRDGTYGWRGHP
eukprot:366217-Chlamydomonas_euryale.AAC.7